MTIKEMGKQWGLQVERIQDIWEDRDSWSNQKEWRKRELLELWKLCNLTTKIFSAYVKESPASQMEPNPENELKMLEAGVLWPALVTGFDSMNQTQQDLMDIRGRISRMRGIEIPFTEEEADEILAEEKKEKSN